MTVDRIRAFEVHVLDPRRAATSFLQQPDLAEDGRLVPVHALGQASGLAADEAVASGIHARLDESAPRLEAAIDAIIGK